MIPNRQYTDEFKLEGAAGNRSIREAAVLQAQAVREKEEKRLQAQQAVATRHRQAEAEKERARRAAQAAKPDVRIGMTQSQVLNDTSWGTPSSRNVNINASGRREQWVYGASRYLYFENGVLTGIQILRPQGYSETRHAASGNR